VLRTLPWKPPHRRGVKPSAQAWSQDRALGARPARQAAPVRHRIRFFWEAGSRAGARPFETARNAAVWRQHVASVCKRGGIGLDPTNPERRPPTQPRRHLREPASHLRSRLNRSPTRWKHFNPLLTKPQCPLEFGRVYSSWTRRKKRTMARRRFLGLVSTRFRTLRCGKRLDSERDSWYN